MAGAGDDRSAVRGRRLDHPARLVVVAFLAGVLAGTVLLTLPASTASTAGAGRATVGTALFTATSAITVTGLVVVDTQRHWSGFGQAVILLLIQLGGLGIMTLASMVLLSLSRKLRLRHRMAAQTETGVLTIGEVGRVVRQVITISLAIEAVVVLLLTARFATTYGEPLGRAIWLGGFHAVSAFNNAGFALFAGNLERFVADPVVNLTVAAAIILGGLGVPVLVELRRDGLAWRRWSLHTRLVLTVSIALLAVSWAAVAGFEWANPATFGRLSGGDTLMASFFHAVSARTAGFNTVPVGAFHESTQLLTSVLMFIGAAPASTGGGIKVTTFALLAFAIVSEMRGDRDVTVFDRRIPPETLRQALAIALIGIGAVVVATLAIIAMGDWGLGPVLLEVTSAFGTTGLSTGITHAIPASGRLVLVAVMFAGRVGPLTVGAALADRRRDRRFRLPEERPLLG